MAVAIVFVAAVAAGNAIHRTMDVLSPADYSRAGHVVRSVASLVVYVALVVAARRLLDRRPLAGLGLEPFPRAWRPLLLGVVAWLVPAAVGVALCLGLGWARIMLEGSAGALAAVLALRLALALIYEALPEELLFRGYLYRNLATVVRRWLAVVGQAVLFALWGVMIGAAGSVDRVALFFVFSIALGVIRVRSGSVWAPIGFHLAFQAAAQSVGPIEGVVAVTDLETLLAVAFVVVPFALGLLIVELVHRAPPGWRERDPSRRRTARRRTGSA